jgi:hypothetical protein
LIALVIGCIYFLSISNSYHAFINYCTAQTGKPFLKPTIQAYLPPTRVTGLRIVAILFALFCIVINTMLLLTARFNIYFEYMGYWVKIFITDFKNSIAIKQYTPYQKKILLIALLFLGVHSLYYINNWAIQHDECWTYNYYINQSWVFSFLAPNNNHYLFTAVCWWANHIPFLDSKITMRLVALLGSVLGVLFYYKLVTRLFNNVHLQLVGLAFFVGSLPLLYYSIMARSYSFTILFVCISMLCFLKIITTAYNKKYFVYLALANALGIFSNITFVYPMLGFIVFSIIFSMYTQHFFTIFIKTWVASIAASLVLIVVPVFLLKGFQPLSAVGLQPVVDVWGNIQLGFQMLSYYFTGHLYASFIWIALIIVSAILFFKTKQPLLLLCLVQFVVSIIIYALQGSHLFERLFTYLVPFVALGILFLFQYLFTNIKPNNYISGFIALLFLVANVYQFKHHFLFNWNIGIDKACTKTAQYLVAHNVDSVYSFYVYPKPCLEYFYHKAGKPIHIALSNAGAVSYVPYDSNYKYKVIISATEDSLHFKNYTTISFDNWVNLSY